MGRAEFWTAIRGGQPGPAAIFIRLPEWLEVDGAEYDTLISRDGGRTYQRAASHRRGGRPAPLSDAPDYYMAIPPDASEWVAVDEHGNDVAPCGHCGRVVVDIDDDGECEHCRLLPPTPVVPGEWRYLPKWGQFYSVSPTGELLVLGGDPGGKVDLSFPYGPDGSDVTLVCEHFLADVNALLRTAFRVDDFDMVSCEGHDVIPPCAASMGCLCAGHARGNSATAPCDTRE